MRRTGCAALVWGMGILAGCSGTKAPAVEAKKEAGPSYFKVDTATAVDMSGDPACVEAHGGKAYDESVVVNPDGTLANVFIYIKTGLEGKKFEISATPVTIDQRGCWFHPRVMGIQTGQMLQVTNSDPVTHNIHPLAEINREWNHSQGQGDAPLGRKFLKPEVMIRVKCNIHSWMHPFIGVLDHPYFAVTGADGTFEIRNIPPGDYVIEAWQETLGTREQKVTVGPSGTIETSFSFKGE